MLAFVALVGALISHYPSEAILERYVRPCTGNPGVGPSIDRSALTGSLDDPRAVYLTLGAYGLFASKNAGKEFVHLTPPHMCVRPMGQFLNPMPAQGQPWCMAGPHRTYGSEPVCSQDQGASFTHRPLSLAPNDALSQILVDPANPSHMVAQVYVGGMVTTDFRVSYNAGRTWRTESLKGVAQDRALSLAGFASDGRLLGVLGSVQVSEPRFGTPVNISPDFSQVTPIKGLWGSAAVAIAVNSYAPNHWVVSLAPGGRRHFIYETFDDGKHFKSARLPSLPLGSMRIASAFGDLAVGGLRFVTKRDIRGVAMVRHGVDGPWKQYDWPPNKLEADVFAAGEAVFLLERETGLYRLREEATTQADRWAYVDLVGPAGSTQNTQGAP